MRIPFATQSYQCKSSPISAQRLVNLYGEIQPPDAKSKLVLFGTPGLKAFSTVGTGPIRGEHVVGGVLYVVSGEKLYRVSAAGVATEIGSVGNFGRVWMSDNGIQLAILAGPDTDDLHVYNVATGVFSTVTDTDYPGASSMTYMDGYTIFSRPDSGQFFISNLLDTTNFDALDYATGEGAPDNTVAVFADHRELWLFGSETTEIWYDSGASDFPFDRISGAYLERGCLSAASIAKADNTVFWLGSDKIVYRADGYVPTRISTHAIEFAIEGYASPETAEAFTYAQDGHVFYCLSFDEATWVYDVATSLWHQRESFDSSGISLGRWRARCYPQSAPGAPTLCYGKRLVGDYETGTVWELDDATYTEGTNILKAIATTPTIHADRKLMTFSSLEVEFESGIGLTTGQGSEPQAMLRWSDDDGRTWSNERWATIGARGKYGTRAIWRRLGRSRSRVFELTITDPVKRVIVAADAEAA